MADKSFQNNFWRRARQEVAIGDVMYKIPTKSHGRVVRLLELVSDPNVAKRLRRSSKEMNAQIVQSLLQPGPSRKELRGLARRLQTISKDVERVFETNRIQFKKTTFLNFAKECRSRSRDLKYIDRARQMTDVPIKAPRKMSYKGFWKHLPMAMLCWELDVPRSVSFADIEAIVSCAYTIQGHRALPHRSIEREYKGFLELKPSDPLKAALWRHFVQNFLDLCAAIRSATK